MGGGMGGMGGGMPDMAQMQQQMQQNPEMMRQMMSNPMMQEMMGNPEVVRSMLTSNPQVSCRECVLFAIQLIRRRRLADAGCPGSKPSIKSRAQ